jgi:error-prone DNA polymerase
MDAPANPGELPRYAELHCRSNFTFLTGASHPAELVERAAALGYAALAITDECSLAGVVRAHEQAKASGLKLLIGADILFRGLERQPFARLVLLATDRNGYGNLAELITLARLRAPKGEYIAFATDLDGATPEHAHLAGLPGCLAILVPERDATPEALRAQAEWLRDRFAGRCWIAAENLLRAADGVRLERIERVAWEADVPIAACGDVLMHARSRKPLLDTLWATRLGRPVAQCGFELTSNAEHYLRPRVRLAQLYPREWLEETVAISDRCRFSLDELRYEYPREVVPEGETPTSYLRHATYMGAARRFPEGIPPNVVELIEHELALIAELRYEPYFLTVYDIVNFARSRGILCQGRGSAANSAVCYCLGVTEVDPARMSMLFERFISKERNEPPDIDIDFEHQRREEVIQYVYAKYGTQRTALTAVVSSYRTRSAIRDIGKALGFDPDVVDRVAKDHDWWDADTGVERLAAHGLPPDGLLVQQWVKLVNDARGFPRHLSQHPGGFVIAQDKLSRLVPIENAAMEDRRVIQWDKDDLDALGLIKVDVLGLGMLSAIRRCLDTIAEREGRPFRMQDIPAEDPAVYAMIGAADTMGVFQIESRAQMSMLPRLRPECFYDLVIEVAIVRPGPIQGGMVHPYLRRRQGLEPVTYPGPEVRQALERTLGVPIFQEQVMQLAVLAAGFTPGEADQLRRSMAAWRRQGGLNRFYDRIVEGMKSRGYSQEFADALFRQIEGFGEYGFPESHAASFALLVYASCWLKWHEPAVYLSAMLNSQPLGFYSPGQLIRDAKTNGVEILPVDVTVSAVESLPISAERSALPAGHQLTRRAHSTRRVSTAVRLGLNRIAALGDGAAQRIVECRREAPFIDVEDLVLRARLSAKDRDALAASGSLATLTGHRRQAAWQSLGVDTRPTSMLRATRIREAAVKLPAPTEGEDIVADYASLGFTLGRHPLALLRPVLARRGIRTAASLRACEDGRVVRASGIVTVRQRPQTAKGVMFATLEDETGYVNIVLWPKVQERQRREILGSQLMTVVGRWQSEQGVQHLIARRVVDDSTLLGRLVTTARDFR